MGSFERQVGQNLLVSGAAASQLTPVAMVLNTGFASYSAGANVRNGNYFDALLDVGEVGLNIAGARGFNVNVPNFAGSTGGINLLSRQKGVVTTDLLTSKFVTEEKLGFGNIGSTNLTEIYRTRPAYEVAALRTEFNGLKKDFMRDFAESEAAMARYQGGEFTPKEFSAMFSGKVPADYDIHHKLPLFRGGDNAFSNLDLMTKTYHETNRFDLHNYLPGKNPYGLNPSH